MSEAPAQSIQAPDANLTQPSAPGEGGTPPPSFTIPQAYAQEKWAQDLKDVDSVWKKLAGAQELIGRRPELPAIPETPDAYEFKTPEALGQVERDAQIDAAVKQIVHKHKLSKEQGEGLVADLEVFLFEQSKPARENSLKVEREFEDLVNTTFGEKRAEVQEVFKKIMKDTLGDSPAAAKIGELSNEQLLPVMAFAKAIHDKYVGETKIEHKSVTSNFDGDIKSQFRALSEQKLKIQFAPDMASHQKEAALIELNKQMMKIGEMAADKGIQLFA